MNGKLTAFASLTLSVMSQPTTAATALVGATIIDVSHAGKTANDITDSVILIDQGHILAVGKRGSVHLPPHTTQRNVRGLFAIPGLIDGYGAVRSQRFADAYVDAGVTTVLVPVVAKDGGIDGEDAVFKPAHGLSVFTQGVIHGSALIGITRPRRSGRFYKGHSQRWLSNSTLRDEVARIANAGNKSVLVGLDVKNDQLSVIVAEAHRRGLPVTAELANASYSFAVTAGVDAFLRNDKYQLSFGSVEDWLAYALDPFGSGGRGVARAACGLIDTHRSIEEFGRLLKRSSTALMPTLSMEATADDIGGPNPWTLATARFFTPADLDDAPDQVTGARPYLMQHKDGGVLAQTCARHKQDNERRLHELGATYLAGSTAPGFGVMPGSGLHEEMKLLVKIGLTPRQALAAATSNYADLFGWTDRGELKPGRRADLVLLTSDPRYDISAIDTIDSVSIGGKMQGGSGVMHVISV